MKLKYALSEADFLVFQLYTVSKSERIRKKRRRSRIVIPLIYTLLSAYFFIFSDVLFLEILFLLVAILWYLFYPLYQRRHYRKHYQNFIREHYQQRVDRISELDFQNDFLLSKSEKSEGKISVEEFEEFIELKNHILLKLRTGDTLIIPKSALSNTADFQKFIFDNYGLAFLDETAWKWK